MEMQRTMSCCETVDCPVHKLSAPGAAVEVVSTCCLHSGACTAAEQVPVSAPAAAPE